MEYSLSLAEARILVLASNCPVKENYADLMAVKLNANASYTAGCIRHLKLAGLLQAAKAGKRMLICNIDKKALKSAVLLIQEQQQQQGHSATSKP